MFWTLIVLIYLLVLFGRSLCWGRTHTMTDPFEIRDLIWITWGVLWPLELVWWIWGRWRNPEIGIALDQISADQDAKNLELVNSWQPPDMALLERIARNDAKREEIEERRKRMATELKALYRDYYGPTGWYVNSETMNKQLRIDPRYEAIIQKYAEGGPI